MSSDKDKKKKFDVSATTLFALPTILFFAMYFLFPVLSESFLKISVNKYTSRVNEFSQSIKANKERYAQQKEQENLKLFEPQTANISAPVEKKEETVKNTKPIIDNQAVQDALSIFSVH